ncbi:MAG: DUF4276 family protein [Gallionella sp.]|nr:DUF4276 family protein [Gallionella sp.]
MVKLYVEGGGDATALKTACREGFAEFLKKAGLTGHMPRIVACGGRNDAYDSFCTAIKNGEPAMLLVDSEEAVAVAAQPGDASKRQDRDKWLPWQHLKQRKGDGWDKPPDSSDTDCHLMVQCMESWFLADRDTLKDFFAQGFKEARLPAAANSPEAIAKQTVYDSLASATHECKTKAQYGKGEHSFKLLALISSTKVTAMSPWALRFVEQLKARMGL